MAYRSYKAYRSYRAYGAYGAYGANMAYKPYKPNTTGPFRNHSNSNSNSNSISRICAVFREGLPWIAVSVIIGWDWLYSVFK